MADMLCTIAQVKVHLFPASPGDTDDDALLTEIVEQQTAWIQGYIGLRVVGETGATYVLDAPYGTVLSVPRGIRTVTTLGVAQSAQPDTGGSYTNVTAANITLWPKSMDRAQGAPATEIRLINGSRFYGFTNGVQLVGDLGWATNPPDLVAVAIDASVAAFQNRKDGTSSAMGVDGIQLPPYAKFFGRGSPQRQTLERYRNWSV